MSVAAIYNVWDGVEFLRKSMDSVSRIVDHFIIVHQDVSNFGEKYNGLHEFPPLFNEKRTIHFVHYTPDLTLGGADNERAKRQLGIEKAKELRVSHFFNIDCDEFYTDIYKTWQQYLDSGKEGSVCKLFTYFKKPTWRFETEDGYFVPFIHKLRPDTNVGNSFGVYPFYSDPTRGVNTQDVALLDTHMHHFSWVRNNIERKCNNSSAKDNIANGTMLKSYYDPACGPGYYVKDYDKKLIEVPNIFNL